MTKERAENITPRDTSQLNVSTPDKNREGPNAKQATPGFHRHYELGERGLVPLVGKVECAGQGVGVCALPVRTTLAVVHRRYRVKNLGIDKPNCTSDTAH